MVDEVKGKETTTPYEKSRLVIQAFNDEGKKTILTQSPTIQPVSQRIIAALAPSLKDQGITLYLRDITQAYVQSTTTLARVIFARPPKEMIYELPPNSIFKVIRPLYGIPEAGTHWFGTYHKHHREKLLMETSTFDPCLLITKDGPFGIVGMQTDDTLILGDQVFVKQENIELEKAKLLAKPAEQLTEQTPLLFNGCKLMMDQDRNGITLVQKGQSARIQVIDPDSPTYKQTYLEQRARGAYIGTICQPEAAFDLSIAAQFQDPGKDEIKALNKRLQWQIDNPARGLHYVPLDLQTAKLFVFVDGSFANNKDLSSQIGYVVVIGNETHSDGIFNLRGNILHWSSTKCKRVTRAVLASELYGMVAGIDMAISISTTLELVTRQLKLGQIPIVVCTDSFSCLNLFDFEP
jgi:Reverse transcriptase (RNA-dependent DNA polymerase)